MTYRKTAPSILDRIFNWLRGGGPAARWPGARVGSFKLETPLGSGAWGELWVARPCEDGRAVAVKFLRVEGDVGSPRAVAAASRLAREARIMASIPPRYVAEVYESGQWHDGTPYYAMELIEGGDLQEWVATHGVLDADQALETMLQLAEALAAAHARGFVHRDIKPSNIVMSEDAAGTRRPKLIDFGVAKSEREAIDLTLEGTLVGTPAYLAPEAVTSSDELGPSADVYALGCVAHFLLTGERPFAGRTPTQILFNAVHTPPKRLPETVPRDFCAVIEACLSKVVWERPTARELAHELADIWANRSPWNVDMPLSTREAA